ncbi:helix-turn-helix protein [Ruminiclostridium sufflavum DSM 19573]|uniref:Helix-turn-helix protein n=1 Tax=Ruminiclostridium sufflavum DSM 19573 TaxID=1121337 RepID=A0A318XLF8_9FIRM|nr:helix-turn-helix transcriptional regulator [Ruminiclostridium sufflavum]PYG88463.1 helix-turn-helix protein [Ruminiclostridium sufflavum DSM 19573]
MTKYKLTKGNINRKERCDIMPIGKLVKKLRESKGVTIYRLSKDTGISQSTISSLENKGKTASFDNVVKIAKALDVPIETFYPERRVG